MKRKVETAVMMNGKINTRQNEFQMKINIFIGKEINECSYLKKSF